jgi:diaminohydroxyphosphoribosylaminopyrimidine deaminase / 5-amino-6-(5-phosphoribosylamino)uracil reductase
VKSDKGLPTRRSTRGFDLAAAEELMKTALEEAALGRGRTSPNPAVGALVVKNGRIVARAHHRRAGGPHAEIIAIEAAGAKARGADLYTTLEPCNHYGRTPPCTEAILKAGLRRVICAGRDPNPLVNGAGIARLRRAGVDVRTGVMRSEAEQLNRPFFKYIRTRLPWVTLKAAASLDGKIATYSGDSRWVSGRQSRRRAHHLRDQVDAVLIGANTARRDNPRLTARLSKGAGRNPARIVLDSGLRLPIGLRLFSAAKKPRTIVVTLQSPEARTAQRLIARGVEVWNVGSRRARIDLEGLLHRLAKEGLIHLLVEGGSEVNTSFLQQRLVDELVLFLAPKLIGADGLSWVGPLGVSSVARAPKLREITSEKCGEDVILQGLLSKGRGGRL